mmetsp:Transcript_18430/g.55560  ORF Transcript_18430/g.55560 Transcript_18430/m.55560 type:complete len:207 (-) Transcript_18430:218-838(-)|eukprot:scaffold95533_cov36-Tisochrysis_lutea.AAC.1
MPSPCRTASTWADEDKDIVKKGNNFYHLMFMITLPAVVAAVQSGACRCPAPADGADRSALVQTPCECGCLRVGTPRVSASLLSTQLSPLPFIHQVPQKQISAAEYNASVKLKRCDIIMPGRSMHSRERGASTYMAACGLEKPWVIIRSVFATVTGLDMKTPHPRLPLLNPVDSMLNSTGHALIALFQPRESCSSNPWNVSSTVRVP